MHSTGIDALMAINSHKKTTQAHKRPTRDENAQSARNKSHGIISRRSADDVRGSSVVVCNGDLI